MNKINALSLLVISSALSLPAHSMGNLQPVEISGIYVRESRTDIFVIGSHNNPLGCVHANQLILDAVRYPNSKAMLATVLAAHTAGKKISGWVVGCTDDRAEMSAIFVEW